MRIALLSDIHANLPALEACLESIDQHQPDAVYCLGDLVGYNIWANEVVNEIRKRGIPTIAGNYDKGIGLSSNECGCVYKTEQERSWGHLSVSYTNSIINTNERQYLHTLPAQIRIEFQQSRDKFNLLLVHGSPRRINEYLFEDRDEKSLMRIMQEADAHIMCFGHTHRPFHRILSAKHADGIRFYHAINTGSVGKPKDGNPRGCYVMLTLNLENGLKDMKAVQVEFVRFDYDVEKAAKAIEASPLPNEYADMLRNGY